MKEGKLEKIKEFFNQLSCLHDWYIIGNLYLGHTSLPDPKHPYGSRSISEQHLKCKKCNRKENWVWSIGVMRSVILSKTKAI